MNNGRSARSFSPFFILESSPSCWRRRSLPEQPWGGRAACRVKSLCVPSMEFGSVLLTFLLLCFSSDQLRDVPVLHLPAGATAAETQRVELLRLLLGKIHPATQKYIASFYLRRCRESANVSYVIVGMFREFLLYGADQKFSIRWSQTSECATFLSFFTFPIPDFGGATSHI